MHDADRVVVCPLPRLLKAHQRPQPSRSKHTPTPKNPRRTGPLSLPSLRVEVESLEQWLDLNA
jgi:hypothetical protein